MVKDVKRSIEERIETKAEFSRRLKITRQSLQRHASAPGFPLTSDGKVLVDAALEWLQRNVGTRAKTSQSPTTVNENSQSLNDARTENLQVQTRRAMLALQKERGELMPYAEARRALAAFVRLNRDVALRFAIRHGPAIAAEVGCDESALIASISSHMRQALNEAADNPKPFPKMFSSQATP